MEAQLGSVRPRPPATVLCTTSPLAATWSSVMLTLGYEVSAARGGWWGPQRLRLGS